ncbi:transcriptional repressor LexA, partial [Kaarinaea lacus]
VLEFIKETIDVQGMPPTVAEITAGLGLSSTNGVRGHLQALARKGAIELIPNSSRGIRLLLDEEAEAGLPIVGRVAAGQPILATENIEDHCAVEANVFKPQADYLLRVNGMSMRDVGILDGDLLAVHRASTADNGQIVVARIEDEVTVKRLRQKKHLVYLEAENPDFKTIKVDLRKEAFAIEGIAVGVLRHLQARK